MPKNKYVQNKRLKRKYRKAEKQKRYISYLQKLMDRKACISAEIKQGHVMDKVQNFFQMGITNGTQECFIESVNGDEYSHCIKSAEFSHSGLVISNDGKDLIATNYWEHNMAKKGLFFLSTNAGAFRLLTPENSEDTIAEMKTGRYCIISISPSNSTEYRYLVELLFEDHTQTPYYFTFTSNQMGPLFPCKEEDGKWFVLSVWTKGCKKVLEMKAYLRFVDRIPYLKPLGKEFKNEK